MVKADRRKIAKVSPIKGALVAESKLSAKRATGEISVVHDLTQRADRKDSERPITGRLLTMLESGLAGKSAEVIRDASIGKIQLKPHQLQIIEMILDRMEGKPKQGNMANSNQVDEHTARLLSELLERRLAAEAKER